MTGFELIRMLVLNEIADDYEEPKHLHEQLASLAERCGMTIQPLDVRHALIDLVRIGWAKAYRLSQKEPVEEVRGTPSAELAEDYYYWITDKGRQVQSCFDDTGEIIPGWRPPVE